MDRDGQKERTRKTKKAVALGYDERHGDAPRVLASGGGLVADKIIEQARAAGIHIQEDPDLVELLARVPIGDQIPPELYQAVAEVLAFVYAVNDRFKKKVKPVSPAPGESTP